MPWGRVSYRILLFFFLLKEEVLRGRVLTFGQLIKRCLSKKRLGRIRVKVLIAGYIWGGVCTIEDLRPVSHV